MNPDETAPNLSPYCLQCRLSKNINKRVAENKSFDY